MSFFNIGWKGYVFRWLQRLCRCYVMNVKWAAGWRRVWHKLFGSLGGVKVRWYCSAWPLVFRWYLVWNKFLRFIVQKTFWKDFAGNSGKVTNLDIATSVIVEKHFTNVTYVTNLSFLQNCFPVPHSRSCIPVKGTACTVLKLNTNLYNNVRHSATIYYKKRW